MIQFGKNKKSKENDLLNYFLNELVTPTEYGGVSIDDLNEIAERCRRGGYVTVSGEELIFHYDSGRGHSSHDVHYIISGDKLKKITQYYPHQGQVYFPDIEFLNECNEQFTFN